MIKPTHELIKMLKGIADVRVYVYAVDGMRKGGDSSCRHQVNGSLRGSTKTVDLSEVRAISKLEEGC